MRHLLSAALALCFVACNKPSAPYDRLCQIYDEYPIDPDNSMMVVTIYERVQREVPEIVPVYDTVMLNGNEHRYEMLRKYARETQHQPDWECAGLKKRWPPGVKR